jgi:UDP-GlcNAc:undecaprenyl-phosphate GlcNAc-1-phosphate transferase
VPALFTFYDPAASGEDFFSERFLHEVEHNVAPAVWPTLVAFAVVAALTPLLILAARRTGFLSYPRARDIHTRPVPYLGGVGMYLGFAAACLAFLRGAPSVPGLLVLGGLTTAVLLVDDRVGMPALVKLGVQVGVAVLAVLVFGFGIHFIFLPPLHVRDLGLFALPVTVVWIVGMQNTINLLDGLDGLAASVVGVTALVLLIASTNRPDQAHVVALSGALAGVCAGFLLFNFHPARIFMGDSGAHFLGLAVALLAVIGVAKIAVTAALLVPVLALALPIADTALAIVRRRRHGQSIAHADTRHLHHRLLELGLTQREICLLFACSTGILGAAGLTVFGHRRILAVAIVLLIVVLSTVLGERLRGSRRRIPVPFYRVVRLLLEGRGLR